ncbi:MAG: hypothetical protein H7X99_02910 [Saprospiraceae bacterium]|nr:hypothetical protein [Saprospiraceae bacterium]
MITEEIFVEPVTENMICFLVFVIKKDSLSNHTDISMIQKTMTKGHLKSSGSELIAARHQLKFDIIGDKDILSSYFIEHPLYKRVEHADAGNVLTSQLVKLHKQEFFVRLSLNPESKFISISEITPEIKQKEIARLKI